MIFITIHWEQIVRIIDSSPIFVNEAKWLNALWLSNVKTGWILIDKMVFILQTYFVDFAVFPKQKSSLLYIGELMICYYYYEYE